MNRIEAAPPAEWAQWRRRIMTWLVGTARLSRDDAEDVAQAAMTRVWLSRGSFDDAYPDPTPWVLRIAYATLGKWSARRARRAALAPEVRLEDGWEDGPADPCLGPDAELERREVAVEAVAILAVLREPYLSVMLDFYVAGMRDSEIAAARGLSVNTVRQRLYRGRKMARDSGWRPASGRRPPKS